MMKLPHKLDGFITIRTLALCVQSVRLDLVGSEICQAQTVRTP